MLKDLVCSVGKRHLPTVAQSCRYVSDLRRPHLALLAEILALGAVSDCDCWELIGC